MNTHVIPANVETETINHPNLSDDDMDVTDSFESFLRSHSSTPTATTSISSVPSIEALLEQYDRVPYQSYKLDIMEYWTTKKHIMPELYELSKVLMAIPATQVYY